MTDACGIVEKALYKIRATSEVNPATEVQMAEGFDELRAMLAEWRDRGIDVGPMDFDNDADDLGEPTGAKYPIITCLAVRLGAALGITVDAALASNASENFDHIYRHYRDVQPLNRPLGENLPKGAGRYQRYFDEGDRVGHDRGLSNIDTL